MALWFTAVSIAHELPQRVRLKYRLATRQTSIAGAEDAFLQLALALPGVRSGRVNVAARTLVLYFETGVTSAHILRRAVAEFNGPPPSSPLPLPPSSADWKYTLRALAVLLATPFLPTPLRMAASLAISAPVFRHALDDWKQQGMTSHGLEAMAVAISLARSDYTAANSTAFLLELGEYLEESIARRSDDLLKNLLRPVQETVWIVVEGKEIEIPTVDLTVGDHVVVGPGVVIPIDGTILSGAASVNEAAMTGESVAIKKERGDSALSGTIVEEGRLVIYAEHVGSQTATARIADYVEQSLTVKSSAQNEASRMADQLVPGVLKLAGASFVLSGDWQRAAAVLQADYSCALKLATPVAFKSAMYAAGQAGILVKGAAALERLAEADTVIFDKTGTLTNGILHVTDAITFDDHLTPEDIICLAASVEEHSFHPLAQSVVAAAKKTHNHHFDHQEVQFIVAHGVASTIDGKRIVVGSRHFIEDDEGIDLTIVHDDIARLYRDGKTLLFIGFDSKLLGILALKDSVRSNAKQTLARLRQMGVQRLIMLTGDHQERAADLAQELALDGFHAELKPQEKASIIEGLARQGAKVAFVGDGINDAPALAQAHIGIAMQRGADIARLTADIALLEDNLERIADAKEIACTAMQRIKTNYHLTVGLNTAILGAAATGALSPVAAAILHNGTTLGILLNALRRKAKKTSASMLAKTPPP